MNRRTKLEAIATVMVVLGGPSMSIETAVIGDANGGVTLLSIPSMEVIGKFSVEGGVVRSLCTVSSSESSFLVATQAGQVWMVGERVPSRRVHLFTHDGPITSMRLQDHIIHIQSGWTRATYGMDGGQTDCVDGMKPFHEKARLRANRRAKIMEYEQQRSNLPQPLMLDLPIVA